MSERPAVPMYWRAEIARAGCLHLQPYWDPERGDIDPLDDPEIRQAVRGLFARMFQAESAGEVGDHAG